MRRLVFIEKASQAKKILEQVSSESGETIWVATTPFASHELQRLGVNHRIPEEFFAPEELMETSRVSLGKLETFASAADSFLQENIVGLKEKGIEVFKFHLHPLFIAYSGTLCRIFQLQKIINVQRPGEVWSFSNEEYPFGIYGLGFHPLENIWGRLLSLKEWGQSGIRVRLFDEPRAEAKEPLRERLKQRLVERWELYEYSRIMGKAFESGGMQGLFRAISGLFSSAYLSRGGQTVMMMSPLYDWAYTPKQFLDAGFRVVMLRKGKFLKESISCVEKGIIKAMESDRTLMEAFNWEGIDFYPVLRTRIAMIAGKARAFMQIHDAVVRHFDSVKPSVICTSSRTLAHEHVICNAAKRMGIPVIVRQHGGLSFYHQTIKYVDLQNTTFYFSFGRGVNDIYRADIKKFGVTSVPVGSVSTEEARKAGCTGTVLRRLKKPGASDSKTALYVTTNLMLNKWYGSYEPPVTDHGLAMVQRQLLEGLSEMRETRVILKEYVSERPLPWFEAIKSERPDRVVSVKTAFSFESLLDCAHLIVIDWPTTTLMYAANTDKPIFVLTSLLRPVPEALSLLRRRAVCHESADRILEAVRGYVSSGRYEADVKDREFIRAYGTHLDDGKSAPRVVEEVISISRKGEA